MNSLSNYFVFIYYTFSKVSHNTVAEALVNSIQTLANNADHQKETMQETGVKLKETIGLFVENRSRDHKSQRNIKGQKKWWAQYDRLVEYHDT